MGLAGQHHALELGVGQQRVGHDALGANGAVSRHGMGHGGHRAGLHERGRMGDGARHPHDARAPRLPGAGGGGGGGCARAGLRRRRLDGELDDRTPVMGGLRRRGGRLPGRRRRDRVAEEVAAGGGRHGPDRLALDGEARRHLRDDRVEQLGGGGGAGLAVYRDAWLGAPLDDGEPGVEAGTAPGIGAPVDRHGEHGAHGAVGEGAAPGGVAGHAVGRGDGGEPSARRQHREGRADVAQIGVVADARDPRRCRERRIHEHDGRPDARQEVGQRLGVVAGDGDAGKQARKQPGADARDFVQVQVAGGGLAERALRHHGQHAGAGAGLEHGVAGPDRGGSQCDIGERQRGGELLEPDLRLGALRVRGLQRGDGREHVQHPAGAARAGAGPLAHGAPVAADEHHDGRFGRLVGVLPDPGALGVARTIGAGHGVAQCRGVEGPAGFQHREQAPGGVEERSGAVRCAALGAGDRNGYGGKLRARGRARRRMGVEHGVLRSGRTWKCRPGGAGEDSRAASPGLPPAGCLASGRHGAGTCGIRRWRRPGARRCGRGGVLRGGCARRACRGRGAGDGRPGQPKRRPSAVNVYSLTSMASSTAVSEVRSSYSRSSWR